MNSEEVIKRRLEDLQLEYRVKINQEIEEIEQKRRLTPTGKGFLGKVKATGNAALEKGQKELVRRKHPNVAIVPDIPEQILLTISKVFEKQVDPKLIIGIIDTSLLHNGTKGYVFTGEKMYVTNGETKEIIELGDFEYVSIQKININEGQEDLDPSFEDVMKVTFTDHHETTIRTFPLEPIFDILKKIKEETTQFEETDQRVKQESMSDIGKMNYAKIAVNYLMADDGMIDANEYASLIALISEFSFNEQLTNELREYRLGNVEPQETKYLIDALMEEVPSGSREAVSLSLINSILTLKKGTVANWGEDAVLNEFQTYLGIPTNKVQFMVTKLLNEMRIEKERLSDAKVSELASNTLAAGSAIGFPFAALATTGAIAGLGGTSGGLFLLAAVSTGTMIASITAIGAASFGVYKGVKYLSSGNTTEKYIYRQSKLQASLINQQKATNMLLQDINWLSGELEKVISLKDQVIGDNSTIQAQFEVLKNFIEKIQRVSNAAKVSEDRRIYDEKELLLTQLPDKLDINKLEMLGEKSIDWEKEASIVYGVYQEMEKEMIINVDMLVEDYHAALNILTRSGYFKPVSGLESGAKQGFQKLKDTVSAQYGK